MRQLSQLERLREHPLFWLGVTLLFGLLVGSAFFQFFTGFSTIEFVAGERSFQQTVVSIQSGSDLDAPPILLLPQGSSLLNSSYAVDINGLYTAYEWWLQFPNNTFHGQNIWEPVYQYWYLLNPLQPQLYAVYIRFHFFSRLLYHGWTLNGTRIFVSFSPGFYIPSIGTGDISSLLKPSNATVIQSYTPVLDPKSPYPTGPNAYAPGAGPQDPWAILGGPQTITNGLIYGTVSGASAGTLLYGVISVTVHPRALKHRFRIKKKLAAVLADV